MEDVKHLCEVIFHSMGEKDWKPLCEHVKKLENECYDRDARFDIAVDPIIISLGDVESYNSDSSEEDSSTDKGQQNAWHRITYREQWMTAVSSKCFELCYTCSDRLLAIVLLPCPLHFIPLLL
jgi:hypothetical protein